MQLILNGPVYQEQHVVMQMIAGILLEWNVEEEYQVDFGENILYVH